jgi:hypothetical protein
VRVIEVNNEADAEKTFIIGTELVSLYAITKPPFGNEQLAIESQAVDLSTKGPLTVLGVFVIAVDDDAVEKYPTAFGVTEDGTSAPAGCPEIVTVGPVIEVIGIMLKVVVLILQ